MSTDLDCVISIVLLFALLPAGMGFVEVLATDDACEIAQPMRRTHRE
jgi:hypothetical protein